MNTIPAYTSADELDRRRVMNEETAESRRQIELVNKGFQFTVRRVDEITGKPMAEGYKRTYLEAVEDAKRGTTECLYEIRHLNGGLITRVRGERT